MEGFDETLVTALSSVTNVQIEGEYLRKVVLPVRIRGLGIRMSKDIALPSFISSIQSDSSLVESVSRYVRLGCNGGLQAATEA